VAALAGRQHGVVSARQLAALGMAPNAIGRRVRTGRLHRLHRGVYAVGHLALTQRSRELAAVLACGPRALLSHRSAGCLWGLLPGRPPKIEVTAPRTGRPRDGLVVHRSRVVDRDDRAVIDAVPVTGVARTLVDLADVLTPSELARAVEQAEILRVFDLRALERTLARLPGRAGPHRLRRVLVDYAPDPAFTRSEAERRFLRLCAAHGLPHPAANLWIAGHEVDLYWADAAVAVEVDGAAYHRTARAFRQDRARDRALAAQGIQVTRVTWRDLEDETALAAELASIRAARLGFRPRPPTR
jgi:predicted transcriptional regulator of viral defense system